ncbi:feruloyl-CoA synthase [Pararhodobacter zhoushanensis]|uniref:feruloyl-CoA synthase n=1 Tax=Pararhodobacter zhoushanensis TaxID=2479545 RepID=UPI000F8D12B1|nr:feruloyl-CoA synthase [Pararhodobacter zhoushanensis]
MTHQKYRAHDARRQDRPDGSILLTSGLTLGPIARRTTDWLVDWAAAAPDRVFLAERSGAGWREVTYAQALEMVRAIAASLAERGMGAQTPILIVSGNGVDHGLLTLAAQYIGVPTVPVAEQYALIPGAHPVLERIASVIAPRMVFADDAARYGAALALPVFEGVEKLVSTGGAAGETRFDSLLKGRGDVSALNAAVTPDTVAKYLMTSGSTSHPKGVLTTQRMMTTNQAQLKAALPFVADKPLVLLDWLPWNHVFGGSHNFNLVLSNGGTFYIDNGKPTPALAHHTIENLRMVSPSIAFNVPVGFAVLRDAMQQDESLKRQYFQNLDMLFYAGASLPQDIWADLEAMAREVRGEMPLFNSSWGLTETAPAALLQHEFTHQSGIIGVPLPGVTVKLVPADDDTRFEVRVKGDTITPGYLHDPEKTAEAFDEEGYFITGDAMKFVEPGDMNKGLKFDGRIAEEFKLITGTWVRAAGLRLEVLVKLKGLAQDVVITGADRSEVGVLIIPLPGLADGAQEADGALIVAQAAEIAQRLKPGANEGSAHAIRRAMVLAEPPSMAEGEITAKGNLNFRKLLLRRAELVERLYDNDDAATIVV